MESIRVAIRVKPEDEANGSERQESEGASGSSSNSESFITTEGNQLTTQICKTSREALSFSFDKIYSYLSTQDEIFNDCKYLVDAAVDGFNSTIFAFGMTGSGKTYTIAGSKESPGVVPRAIHHLFNELRNTSSANPNTASMVFLTYVELYNNNLYDLLSKCANFEDSQVRIHEHAIKGIILTGSPSLRTPVSSPEEALSLIAKGTLMRSTAVTNLNERSSRSHTVITLEVVSQTTVASTVTPRTDGTSTTSVEGSEGANFETDSKSATTKTGKGGATEGSITKVGRINLVDLAGSERVKESGATGQTLEEAKQINKALSVLGDVLNALSKKDGESSSANSKSFIPYRNSKLTMLLKDSLGGNAKTMMIATIRPYATFFAQTLVTLRYAARAKLIRCNPVRNLRSKDSSEAIVLNSAMNEIFQLKLKLEQRNEEYHQLQLKVKELQRAKDLKSSDVSMSVNQSNDMSRKESEYISKMESIQVQSYEDRQELQEKMKCLISNHESSIDKLQSENVRLEQQLLHQIHEVDKVMEQKQRVETNNEELSRHLSSKLSELSRLHYENTRLRQDLSAANERIAELSTLESDKKQFIDAIKKLNESRVSYKQKCDSQSEDIERANNYAAELHRIIQENNIKLSQDKEEIESWKTKHHECETLLKKAALKIKELVSTKPPLATSPLNCPSEQSAIVNKNIIDISHKLQQLKCDFIGEKDSLTQFRDAIMEEMTKSKQLVLASVDSFVMSQRKSPKAIDEVTKSNEICDSDSDSDSVALKSTNEEIRTQDNVLSLAISSLRVNTDSSEPIVKDKDVEGKISPTSPVRIRKSILKDIEKEMIINMENRLNELKSAKENFVKISGIFSESSCKGDSASWLSIESVLSDLQNKCKSKDAQIFDMQTEIDRLKRDNRDQKAKVKSSEGLVKMQDARLKSLQSNLENTRKHASSSIHQGLELMKSFVLNNGKNDDQSCSSVNSVLVVENDIIPAI